MTSQQLGA